MLLDALFVSLLTFADTVFRLTFHGLNHGSLELELVWNFNDEQKTETWNEMGTADDPMKVRNSQQKSSTSLSRNCFDHNFSTLTR